MRAPPPRAHRMRPPHRGRGTPNSHAPQTAVCTSESFKQEQSSGFSGLAPPPGRPPAPPAPAQDTRLTLPPAGLVTPPRGRAVFLQVLVPTMKNTFGLRHTTGEAAPWSASHRVRLLPILREKTRESTQTPSARRGPQGVEQSQQLDPRSAAPLKPDRAPPSGRVTAGGRGRAPGSGAGWGSGCAGSGCARTRTWCCSPGPCTYAAGGGARFCSGP